MFKNLFVGWFERSRGTASIKFADNEKVFPRRARFRGTASIKFADNEKLFPRRAPTVLHPMENRSNYLTTLLEGKKQCFAQ